MSEDLVVGNEKCRIHYIASSLKDYDIVFEDWQEMARELGVSGAEIKKLMQDLLLNKLTLCDVIHQILEDWKMRIGSPATLGELIGHMEVLKWFHISEQLSHRFGIQYVRNQSIITNKPLPRKLGVEDPVDIFTGRRVELEVLHKVLSMSSSANTDVTVITQRATISGLGGIGKTEMARQYIYLYGESFKNILWLNAESESSIQQSFKLMAKDELNISLKDKDGGEKDIFTVVRQVYREFEGNKTLVVFDNTEIITNFKNYLPTGQQGQLEPTVLLTSRDREWGLGFKMNIISIDELNMEEAIELVKKGLNLSNDDQFDDIKCLLKLLQCFPLAIQQAISYIKQNSTVYVNYCIAKYIDDFKKSKAELLNSKIVQESNTYTQTTLTTWALTMKSVEGDKDHGILAKRIFNIIAYMAPDSISENFFYSMRATVEEQPNLKRALDGIFRSFIYMGANTEPKVEQKVTDDKVKRAIRLLVKYSMVKRVSDTSLSVHRLVQEVTLIKFSEAGKKNHVLQEALELLDKADKNNLSAQGPTIWKFVEKKSALVLSHSRLPFKITSALHDEHKYGEAYINFKDTIDKLNEALPEGHEDTQSFLALNGLYLFNIGKGDEGLAILKDVVEKRKQFLGVDHPITLATMHNVAIVLVTQSKFEGALSMYREVLQKKTQVMGSNHPETLSTMNNIANVLNSQGKFDESLSMNIEVLGKQRQVLGSGHPDVLVTMHNMAIVLQSQGKLNEALSIHKEVLEKRQKILGSHHPRTLTTMQNLASVLKSQKKIEEAFLINKEVLEKQTQILGSEHPETLATASGMAALFDSQGRFEEAFSMYTEILEKQTQNRSSYQLDTLKTTNNMAHALYSQQKFDEALSLYKKVFKKRTQIFGLDHPDTLKTKYNMALVFDSQGRFEEALSMNEEVLEKQIQVLGSDHPDTLNTMQSIVYLPLPAYTA